MQIIREIELADIPALFRVRTAIDENRLTLDELAARGINLMTSPTISSVQISGANLQISGSGGTANWPFQVLAATNLPTTNWVHVATNQFNASGIFSLTLTNAVNPNQPQTFYRLRLQ